MAIITTAQSVSDNASGSDDTSGGDALDALLFAGACLFCVLVARGCCGLAGGLLD